MNEDSHIQTPEARAFLSDYLGTDPGEVTLVGEGAWSRCFGFRHENEALVIRFGRYGEDFRMDRRAYAYAAPGLPIPEVRDIGTAFDGYYAVSTRAYGIPLEEVSAETWAQVVPSVADMLEALRLTEISPAAGAGAWGRGDRASHETWSDFLLSVAEDRPEQRTHGWRKRLETSAVGSETFRWALDLLAEVAEDRVPIALIHGDLLHGNVLVHDGAIDGVFDWGCSLYGDHLYDLAWFDFWAPWHPQLDVNTLWEKVREQWRVAENEPRNLQRRLAACHLRIGLDHLAYHAHLGNRESIEETSERMRTLEASWHTGK